MKAHIRKIIIGFKRKESDRLINELGNEGIIHVGKWDGSGIETSAVDVDGMENSVNVMLNEIENVCSELKISLDYQPDGEGGSLLSPVIFKRDIESDRLAVKAIRDEMDGIQNLRQKYQAEKEELRIRLEAARDFAAIIENPGSLPRMSLCSYVFGTLRNDIDVSDKDLYDGYYIRHAGRHVLGIALPGDRDKLIGLLEKNGFEDKEQMLVRYATYPHELDDLKDKAELMKKELFNKEEHLNERIEERIRHLAGLHEIYTALRLSIGAKKGFLRTEDAEFISGWIDLDDLDRLVSVLERVCGKRFFLHMLSGEEIADGHNGMPVRLRNRWFFRAFEIIIRNAGIPGSLELDPTPVATIAYLLMFGVMFGDIGQGLVLCLAGIIMKIAAKQKKLRSFYHDSGAILIAAGLSAGLFGVLYGSMFSNEHILPALWFHPMEHIMDLFFATIMMGASFITLGLIMNIYNLYKAGEYYEAIFGIHGILGFIVYTGSLFLSVRYIQYDIQPDHFELILIIVFPVGLFLFRNIAGYIFLGHEKIFPNGIFEYIVESFVELMEMFTGFLGNSISFIRAGAFALSHAGLSIAVYTLAAIASPGISIASLTIIVIGNVFIILLEGLVCGIQSMRLEYYEFFSKFFRGDGVEFKPFSIRRKQVIAKGVA